MRIILRKQGDGRWAQSIEFAISDIFGRRDPRGEGAEEYYVPRTVVDIVKIFLKNGLEISDRKAAALLGIKKSWVSEVRLELSEELKKLLIDAQLLGYSSSDLAMYLELGSGEAFLKELKLLYQTRAEAPAGLLGAKHERKVKELWREYREMKAFQGASPDAYELDPPRWFVEEELGLGPDGEVQLTRIYGGSTKN